MICSEEDLDIHQVGLPLKRCLSCGKPSMVERRTCPRCLPFVTKAEKTHRLVLQGQRHEVYSWCLRKGYVEVRDLYKEFRLDAQRLLHDLSVAYKARQLIMLPEMQAFEVFRVGKGAYFFRKTQMPLAGKVHAKSPWAKLLATHGNKQPSWKNRTK